jgi:hypothetical protein
MDTRCTSGDAKMRKQTHCNIRTAIFLVEAVREPLAAILGTRKILSIALSLRVVRERPLRRWIRAAHRAMQKWENKPTATSEQAFSW